MGARGRWTAVGAAAALLTALASGVGAPGHAQEAALPAPRFGATEVSPVGLPNEVRTVAVGEADAGAERPVTVVLASTLPEALDLRISVEVGVPDGELTRASLFLGADASETGVLEQGTAGAFTPAGPLEAEVDADRRTVTLAVPADAFVAGGAIRVQTEWQGAGGTTLVDTPWFGVDALAGDAEDGRLAGNRWARQAGDDDVVGTTDTGVPSPALTTANRALLVVDDAAVPTELDGVEVTGVSDFVRFVDGTPGAGVDFVRIDRITGDVQLLEASDGPMTDVGAGGDWLGQGPDPADPGAAGTVSLDIPALTALVGLSDAPGQLAVSVDRAYTLADGTTVTNYGVTAALAWLDVAAADAAGVARTTTTASDPAAAAEATDEGSERSPVVLAAAASVVVILVLAAVALVVRRRRGAADVPPASDRSSDPGASLAEEGPPDDAVPAEPSPPADAAATRGAAPAPGRGEADRAAAEGTPAAEASPGADATSGAEHAGEDETPVSDDRRRPEDALAALDALLADLNPPEGGSDPTPGR